MELVRKHLKPLERLGRVLAWDDRQIVPGSKWRGEIRSALEDARAGILLVSPDFLASDFILDEELQPLLAKPTVFWIAISHSLYRVTPLEEIQAAHDPSQPLDTLSEAEQNRVLVEILGKLESALAPR
jgi:hypothetical protein